MTLPHSQSLEDVLRVIAEAPIQDLISCSSQLLQDVRDKVFKAVPFDQETESTSQPAINQASQNFPSKIRKQRTILS